MESITLTESRLKALKPKDKPYNAGHSRHSGQTGYQQNFGSGRRSNRATPLTRAT